MQLKGEQVEGAVAGQSQPQVQFLEQEHAAHERVVVAMSYHHLLEMCGLLWQLEAVRAELVQLTPQMALALHYICDRPLLSGLLLLLQLFWYLISYKFNKIDLYCFKTGDVCGRRCF